ncbi:MAG: hypothetical protein DRI57_01335 [Deltaproteobacteria bacterium]|nr:MAG: hypothetical protein DRI57_01335 [Deltaproteobacteria bacterium]
MKAITFFGGAYSGADQLAEKTASTMGCRLIHDKYLIEKTSETHKMKISDIEKSIYAAPPFPERFSYKKARCIAAVKSVLAEEIRTGAAVFSGFLGELIPHNMALHVLVTSGSDHSLQQAFREEGIAGDHAAEGIRHKNEAFYQWTHYLEEAEDWNPSTVVASDRMALSEVIEEIVRGIEEKKEARTDAVEDFALSAKIASVMAEKGYPVTVSAQDGRADLTILNHVVMLSWHEKKLAAMASAVSGVREVRTRVGRHFYQNDIYRRCEFALSSKSIFRSIEKQYEEIYRKVSGNPVPFIEKRDDLRLSSRL